MLLTLVNSQPTHRMQGFRGSPILLLFLLFGVVSYGYTQQSDDFDQDGIPDHRDLDQDNDGLLNQAEGYQTLPDPSGSDTYRLVVDGLLTDVNSGQQAGAQHQFELIDNETDSPMFLQATIVSANTTLNWSVHQNSALLVSESGDGQLIFTANVSAGGEHVAEAVTLHLREQNEVLIEYHSSENTDPLPGLKNNRAGFRHNLNRVPLSNYFPLSQQRDTDGDGVADHRDLDSDNDGVSDIVEAGGIDLNFDGIADGGVNEEGIPIASGKGLLAPDLNEDGVADPYDFLPDFDRDGLADFLDIDSDEDGLFDLTEAGGTDQDNNGLIDALTDKNGDGWDDRYLNSVYFVSDMNNNGEADQLDPLVPEQALLQNDASFALPDSSTQLKTGLKGSGGCVFNPRVVSTDFGLLILLWCAFLAVGFRDFKGY